jgi:hypothetical protein
LADAFDLEVGMGGFEVVGARAFQALSGAAYDR